jgi:hydrogenase expression/formation protein HypE
MKKETVNITCPIPSGSGDKILLAHGGGGSAANKLIADIFLEAFNNNYLNELHDGGVFEIKGTRFAFTTDSFIVKPLFFPGGNIGDLAVNGTVNDIAMCGARPLFISAAFIIEEGFNIEELKRIAGSMQIAAAGCGVEIITGDTKVVEKGKGDGVFINTSGIGIVYDNVSITPSKAQPGDKIILTGTIADHGMAVISAREELGFISDIKSDTAPLNSVVELIFSVTKNIHVLRDPTRGGVAGVLNEISKAAGVTITIDESRIRITEEVKSACELLGFDPLYIANEGKCIIILPENESEKVLQIVRTHPYGVNSEIIGEVTGYSEGEVILKTLIGTSRTLDMLPGDQLPRIC